MGIRCKALVTVGPESDGVIPGDQAEAWVDLRIPWVSIGYIYRHVWEGKDVGTAIVDFNGNTVLTDAPFEAVEQLYVQVLASNIYKSN